MPFSASTRTTASARSTLRRWLLPVVVLPVVATLAVLAYAWPAARIAPRDVPVGIVGTGQASQRMVEHLTSAQPGAFDLHVYADMRAARSAVKDRDIYGAFDVTAQRVTVLEATAASATVAQSLDLAGKQTAARLAEPVAVQDVVATSADDPRGVVFSSALLPLTICSILIGATVTVLGGGRSRWKALVAVAVASAVAGLGTYLVAQGLLGALPHHGVATWAALSATVLSMSLTAAGLARVIGPAGAGVTALVMVFIGNPFSAVTSAPSLLPTAVHHIGQALPPGAGANLLRSTAYFDGHAAGGHVVVLALWTLLGATTLLLGRRAAPVPAHAAREVRGAAEVRGRSAA